MFRQKLNQQAARERLTAYLDRLYGYACSLTRDPELARDLVQTAAVKALAARKIPDDEPAYRAWLFIILRNVYRDEMRQRGRAAELSFDQLEESAEQGNKSELPGVCSSERVLITQLTVRSFIEQLDRDHREIITLVDLVGFSYRECAAILGVPAGTVMSRISRARKRLLMLMKQGLGDESENEQRQGGRSRN